MADSDTQSGKYDLLTQLFELINTSSKQEQFTILKHLLKDHIDSYLFKIIIDLPADQQTLLHEQLQTDHFKEKDMEDQASQTIDLDEREAPRKPCLLSVDFSTEDISHNDIVRDISIGGLFIETGAAISIGRELELNFQIPDSSETMKVSGKIVWKNENGVGLQFNNLNKEQAELIKHYTDEQKEQE